MIAKYAAFARRFVIAPSAFCAGHLEPSKLKRKISRFLPFPEPNPNSKHLGLGVNIPRVSLATLQLSSPVSGWLSPVIF